MRQSSNEPLRRGLGLLVAVALGLGLTGCGLVSSGDGAATPVALASPEPISPRALVNLAALSNVDVKRSLVVVPIKNGTKVKGQPTLDYCRASFSSEKHRVARRQVVVNLANGTPAGLSNEVVAYDSEEQATKALEEMRAAVARCSSRWVKNKSRPSYRVAKGSVRTTKALPVPDNSVVTSTIVFKHPHRTVYLLEVFQRHGVVLDIFYSASPKPFTRRQMGNVMAIAVLGGNRLAAT